MIFAVIAIILILLFIAVLFYFFALAFIKQNMGDIDDVDSPINKPLENYKETIRKGIEHVQNTEHKWVYTVSFDGLKLAARYYDNNSKNTVILFHGYRSSAARDFSCAVKMYMSFGFNVLLCDQRSHGRSEGVLITFGVKERQDVLVWTEYAIEKLGAEKIVLGGISMGATTVLLSLPLGLPQNVKAAVVDCGFTSPIDIIKKVARDSFKINPTLILPLLNVFCKIFGKFSLYGVNTKDAVKDAAIPIMIIHGKADNFVPCSMSEETFECCNKTECKLLTVEKAQHGLSYLVDPESVNNNIKHFLSKII